MRGYSPVLAAGAASAQNGNGSLTCNRDFAQIGDAKYTILQKCGEPVFKDSYCRRPEAVIGVQPMFPDTPADRRNIVINGNACDQVEEWTYKPGSGQFVTLLLFQEGVLKSIRYAGRIP